MGLRVALDAESYAAQVTWCEHERSESNGAIHRATMSVRWSLSSYKRVVIGVLTTVIGGCAAAPPGNPGDLCEVFQEKRGWYDSARESSSRWGVPVPVQMAIMRHESRFEADARPPRRKLLGFIPTTRPSSAYGYPQALDETWDWYIASTSNWGADRDDFADSVDFIGWYCDESYTRLGIPKNDAYRQYLAYHEGHGGYANGSYRNKAWLHRTAQAVQATARRYAQQLNSCETRLASGSGWWPF